MGQGIDGGLTANLLHTSLIDCTLGKSLRAKVEITYLFLRGGVIGGIIQMFYIYAWMLFWVFVFCVDVVSLC